MIDEFKEGKYYKNINKNEFKIGYYYKFIGNIEDCLFTKKGYDEMKKILNGKWHKCIDIGLCADVDGYKAEFVQFEDMKDGHIWIRKHFKESKYNPCVKKLLEETNEV